MVERSTVTRDEGSITGLVIIDDMIGSRNSSGAWLIKSSSDALAEAKLATFSATDRKSPIRAPRPIRLSTSSASPNNCGL